MIERSAEAIAFLDTINQTPPQLVSACDGWTAHEVAAHVAGIAVEVNRHLAPYLQGDSVPPTRGFEEREAPLQALDHELLLDHLVSDEERMRGLVSDVLQREPDAVIPWTGRQMAVAKFIPHLRNEYALHRWDITGDDALSFTLLAQSDLLEHSVEVLGAILLRAGRQHDPTPDVDFSVRLRCIGHQDLMVLVDHQTATLAWADEDDDEPAVEMDPAARHLFIWGRRPDSHDRLISCIVPADLARLQMLLSGY